MYNEMDKFTQMLGYRLDPLAYSYMKTNEKNRQKPKGPEYYMSN